MHGNAADGISGSQTAPAAGFGGIGSFRTDMQYPGDSDASVLVAPQAD